MLFSRTFTSVLGLAAFSLPVLASPLSNITDRAELDERVTLASVYTTCVSSNHVALTFDDGPYIYLRQVVDTLDAAGVKGTFFWNGNNWDCIYDRVSDINYVISKGHQIAQHTWSHPELPSLSLSQIRTEFSKINTAIKKITGKMPAMFRPPYGDYNNNVRQVAAENGQIVVTWNQDSGDSVGATMTQQKAVYSNFIKKKSQKAIFLNHETYKSTVVTLLPYAIAELKKGGYEMVTLATCLGKSAYLSQGSPAKKDSTWHC
ncbi:carbohydrate esterase family 4 protein [Clavulina sp. PMI_390]|nr:carbohydrate esterase family 4 protein [Clavulina sp. PMI_390]